MKYFVEILKQFSQTQRLVVLVLLLTFTTGGVLISQYLKKSDCRSLINENIELQEDFVKISKLLRQNTLKENFILDTMMIPPAESSPEKIIMVEDNSQTYLMDSITKIVDKHVK